MKTETQPGGLYRVGDRLVDANGNEAKQKQASAEAKEEKTPTDTGGASAGSLDGVTFASPAAQEAAEAAKLTAADFKGVKAAGENGFTKPEVQSVIDGKQAK